MLEGKDDKASEVDRSMLLGLSGDNGKDNENHCIIIGYIGGGGGGIIVPLK